MSVNTRLRCFLTFFLVALGFGGIDALAQVATSTSGSTKSPIPISCDVLFDSSELFSLEDSRKNLDNYIDYRPGHDIGGLAVVKVFDSFPAPPLQVVTGFDGRRELGINWAGAAVLRIRNYGATPIPAGRIEVRPLTDNPAITLPVLPFPSFVIDRRLGQGESIYASIPIAAPAQPGSVALTLKFFDRTANVDTVWQCGMPLRVMAVPQFDAVLIPNTASSGKAGRVVIPKRQLGTSSSLLLFIRNLGSTRWELTSAEKYWLELTPLSGASTSQVAMPIETGGFDPVAPGEGFHPSAIGNPPLGLYLMAIRQQVGTGTSAKIRRSRPAVVEVVLEEPL